MAEHAQVGARPRANSGSKTTAVRRRPKDRKAQIAAVAAEAFSERGYHGVSIDEIAKTVGISGPALYRHFPNKYALFLHSVNELADSLARQSTSSTPATTPIRPIPSTACCRPRSAPPSPTAAPVVCTVGNAVTCRRTTACRCAAKWWRSTGASPTSPRSSAPTSRKPTTSSSAPHC